MLRTGKEPAVANRSREALTAMHCTAAGYIVGQKKEMEDRRRQSDSPSTSMKVVGYVVVGGAEAEAERAFFCWLPKHISDLYSPHYKQSTRRQQQI